jgi:hypothetical protein
VGCKKEQQEAGTARLRGAFVRKERGSLFGQEGSVMGTAVTYVMVRIAIR